VLEGGLKNDSMEVSEKVKMAKVREVAVDWDLDKWSRRTLLGPIGRWQSGAEAVRMACRCPSRCPK